MPPPNKHVLVSFSFFSVLRFIHIWEGRARERERDLLVSDSCNSQVWDRLKPESRNSLAIYLTVATVLRPSSAAADRKRGQHDGSIG